jgi:Tol biopolymer transport system component
VPFSTGTRLGAYEILSAIGQGGMGEVYRARDTRLNRDVAIKVLPSDVAADHDRLARFEREAQVLASLNHPNIAQIHGVEDSSGTPALVMELVEGPTLADRIAKGPIPLDEALPIAKQIAEALEAAHEQGIIHRDLKPANIKVRPDGTVKVLDFGLAKAFDPVAATAGLATLSPTLSIHATQAGIVLGTAAYMAPEQVRGTAVDKRADIWAFGVVLTEMLVGHQLFGGDTISDTLAGVLREPIGLERLPYRTPQPVRDLLRRCLERDPKRRLRDIGEARITIEDYLANPRTEAAAPRAPRAGPGRWPAAIVGAVAVILLGWVTGATGWLWWGRQSAAPAKMTFDVITAPGPAPNQLALSPDGTRLVAMMSTPGRSSVLWLRRLDEGHEEVLAPISGVTNSGMPFWSADSRFVAFFADGKLNKIDASGGPSQTLCDAPFGRGGTWNREGVILFAPSEGPLFRVAAGGGPASQVTELDRARGDTAHQHPKFLPDGEHFIFLVRSANPQNSGLYVGSLGSKVTSHLVATDDMGVFAAPDHLMFVRGSTLMAQRFDARRFELRGDPFPVAQDVGINSSGNGVAGITASDTGVIAYRTGTFGRVLRWVDRTGTPLGDVGEVGPNDNVALAPSGDRIVETRRLGGTANLWIVDLHRGSSSRFTRNSALDDNAIWSPDSQQIVFASSRDGGVRNLYRKNANGVGPEELLLKTDSAKYPTDWSRDGRYLLYTELSAVMHAGVLPLSGDRKPFPFLNEETNQNNARFSPDGHWVAYTSLETGEPQVYVQSFPPGAGKWSVSTTSGGDPRWRGDGRELFYTTQGSMWSVEVTTSSTALAIGVPRKLFDVNGLTYGPLRSGYDVTQDGERFLLNLGTMSANSGPGNQPIRVVINWTTSSKP